MATTEFKAGNTTVDNDGSNIRKSNNTDSDIIGLNNDILGDNSNIEETIDNTSDIRNSYNEDNNIEDDIDTGLEPNGVEESITIEDFTNPLEEFEVDNLKVALFESDTGADFYIKFEDNGFIVTDELIADAKSVGISDKQIDGFISYQQHQADKVFGSVGLSYTDGVELMKKMNRDFNQSEMDTFKSECETLGVTKSLQVLKAYYELEGIQ